jgi:hypothetical protein
MITTTTTTITPHSSSPQSLVSLAVKEFHLPDGLVLVKWRGALDFSPLHSHTMWHCGVWVAQCLYLAMYSKV